jgi:hypothetical protein
VQRKVEAADIPQAVGGEVRYNQLREHIMTLTECSTHTAQLAIIEACQQGSIPPPAPTACRRNDSFSTVRTEGAPGPMPKADTTELALK